MSFERVYSGAAWESRYGYCRALRAGPVVYLTGTAPIAPDGGVHKPGDAAAQTLRCYEIMETALRRFELDRRSIVRCRMYVTDISRPDEFGRAHAAFFLQWASPVPDHGRGQRAHRPADAHQDRSRGARGNPALTQPYLMA